MRHRIKRAERRQLEAKLKHFELLGVQVYEPRINRAREKAVKSLFASLRDESLDSIPDLAYRGLSEPYMRRILVDMCGHLGGEAAEKIEREFASLQKKSDRAWQRELSTWANENLGAQITGIEDTFRGTVRAKLRNTLNTMPEMSVEQQTQHLFDKCLAQMGAAKWQARRIIQTESLAFMAQGERLCMEALDLNLYKTWCAAFNNTRPQHATISGTCIPMDELFQMPNGDKMYGPHDMVGGSAANVINCSCGLIYSNSKIIT